ncbi:MAG: excisionase family DNA-binding protein [Terriglobales bacterium]
MAIPTAPQSPPPTTLFTVQQLAERTGASESYWRRQIRQRRIRVYRLGDLVRIAETDLAAFLAARAEPAQASGRPPRPRPGATVHAQQEGAR